MTFLDSTWICGRRLAALALAIVLAVLAASAPAPGAPRATTSIGGLDSEMTPAFDGGAADRGRKVPVATSGNFLLRKGGRYAAFYRLQVQDEKGEGEPHRPANRAAL